jgi:hypothetical protein
MPTSRRNTTALSTEPGSASASRHSTMASPVTHLLRQINPPGS